MDLSAIIEAILVASEEPLSSSELARLIRARVAEAEEALQVEREESQSKDSKDSHPEAQTLPVWLSELAPTSANQVITAIAQLNQSYLSNGRSFSIIERAKGWKIYTNPEYADFVRQLFPGQNGYGSRSWCVL